MNANTRDKLIEFLTWFELWVKDSDTMKRLSVELKDALQSDETIL